MLTAYPVAGKKKSLDICLAFVRSCGGQIAGGWRDGDSFFYGVDQSNMDLWRAAQASGRTVWSADNSYFDAARQQSFRITRGRLQHSGIGTSGCARFDAIGVPVQPWRSGGEHIVVCAQSDAFMRDVAVHPGWLDETLARLRQLTARPIRMRRWRRQKHDLAADLARDLEGAHALVTWSSAAAVTALLAGLPAVACADDCAARPLATPLDDIESPRRPDGRREWAGVLADNEWSLDEIRDGTAWRMLNG